jgi:competence protein ComEA
VSGAVARPGLYGLAVPARVGDALVAAGGLTEEANRIAVNQAELLWDGAQVHVPELQAGEDGATAEMLPPVGISGGPNAGRSGMAVAAGGLVDLNTASATELEGLSGIGPSKAEAIIANRPYASVDDLERVPGIGAKTVGQLRDLVTVR